MPLVSKVLLKPLTGRRWLLADIEALGKPKRYLYDDGRTLECWALEHVMEVYATRYGKRLRADAIVSIPIAHFSKKG